MARRDHPPVYAFGPFRFDRAVGLLTRNGEPVSLTPKAAQVLRVLLERQGKVVAKDDLLGTVWPETHVHESSLTFQMSEVRRALGDDAEGQRYIRTLPKRGYQFIAHVTIVDERQPIEATPRGTSSPVTLSPEPEKDSGAATVETAGHLQSGGYRRWITAAIGVILATVVLAIAVGGSPTPPPRVMAITRLTHDGRVKGDRLLTDGSRVFYHGVNGDAYIDIASSDTHTLDTLEGFTLLDLSKDGETALAVRLQDRGAEDALWIVPLGGGAPRRLAMLRARNAAWSNDGRRIAYTHDNSLYLTDSDAASVTTLTATAGVPSRPQWSPDDRFIRVTVTTFSDRTASDALWDVNTEGGEPRKVFTDVSGTCCGRWIPDGREFVFMSRESDGATHLWLLRDRSKRFGRRTRDLIELETGNLRILSPISERRRPAHLLHRCHAAAARSLRHRPPRIRAVLEWTVGLRRRFLPRRAMGDLRRAAQSDVVARAIRWKRCAAVDVSADEGHRRPTWSPDGTRIALAGQMPGNREKIYVMSSAGGSLDAVVADDVAQGTPTWSPDGTRLTFGDVPEQWAHPTGSEAITIYDLRSRDFSFVPGSNGLWASRWSPDGRYLAALTIDKAQTLKLFDFTRKEWRSLGVSHMNHLTWSRDSKWIYCDPEGPEHRLRRVRVADGVVETLVDLKDYTVPWGGVALDGSPLITRVLSDTYALELERR